MSSVVMHTSCSGGNWPAFSKHSLSAELEVALVVLHLLQFPEVYNRDNTCSRITRGVL